MKFIRSSSIALVALGLVITAASCKKTNTAAPAVPSQFKDIKASSTFDWSTAQNVNVRVAALATDITEQNMLKVQSTDGKEIYYIQFLSMKLNVTAHFLVPRGTTRLLVTYGSIQKMINITNGTASFNYTTELPN